MKLTNLASVKNWLDIPSGTTTSDARLERLIDSASQFALGEMGRGSLAPRDYVERRSGMGSMELMLKQAPIIEVTRVIMHGRDMVGWEIEPLDELSSTCQKIYMTSDALIRGRDNVIVHYRAGFQKTEDAVVPSSGDTRQVTVLSRWLTDEGVTLDGEAMEAVSGTPAAGQYSVSAGVYTFHEDDEGGALAITYGYVPADIEQAVVELVGERHRAAERIGINSKSLGGQETISYSTKDMSDNVRSTLGRYRRVVPL